MPNAGSDDSIDSDGELRNGVPCIASAPTGAAGSFIPTYDFGFWKPAAIGDRVWEDTNHNGIQDASEHGVGGVGVALHDSSGATIAHAVTDANGLYLFDRLPPGTYNVCFELGTIPGGFSLTTKDAPGSTRANGSDAGADRAISTCGARREPVEEVEAVGIGDGMGDRCAAGVVQRDADPADAVLAGVLDAVVVRVLPDPITDGGGFQKPKS